LLALYFGERTRIKVRRSRKVIILVAENTRLLDNRKLPEKFYERFTNKLSVGWPSSILPKIRILIDNPLGGKADKKNGPSKAPI
jgi:hypothetical protein